ncbi:hypothetical protein [Anoxybacillus flavithermus]|uniref:hypothetical protein n=1 Tax=Anoxybacillus flavithermus TaxID=33934 RepID=UPI0007D94E85|nr:hypothetical protein [Anoxybacillus flavithermus]MBE2939436.1 hypothetical protein [Anoxybacillus flavithermus]MBE2941999.1 hypothetical protein [Anoxybacillus flavithermus]MBE2950237.1 hypothetical protein [Anoxybacillus flavithermus]MBE2952966.1 hypothetical protein [Anoxybacillus flavithermus]MBE2958319.1 hypothetical protein [Anoxybacillus flavithermus]
MMTLIDWLLDNIFVVFILGAFISWIGKRIKTVEETVERTQQQEQKTTVVVAEVEPKVTTRPVKKVQEQMTVSQPAEEQHKKTKQLPTHPLVQGVIFSEVLGPPRAKLPYGRK